MTIRFKKQRLTSALALAGLFATTHAYAADYIFRVQVQGLKAAVALQVSPGTVSFGNVAVGQTIAQNLTVSNAGGTTATGLQYTAGVGFSVSGSCGATLAPGAQCVEVVTFAPTQGTNYAADFRVGNIDQSAIATLSGTGLQTSDSVNAGTLTFAGQALGTTSPAQSVQLTNTGNTVFPLGQIATSGNYTAVQNCGSSLAIGSSCAINVTFTPTNINANPGTLSIPSSAGTQTVTLTGTGLGAVISPSPASLAFGYIMPGQSSAAQSLTLTNSGNAPASSLVITAPTGYSDTSNCGTSLAAGASCSISVTFSPAAQQSYGGSLQVTSNTGTQNVSLSGAGGAAAFTASTSSLTLPATEPGTTSTAALTITNNGTVAATPSVVASSYFSATGCGNLAPGASCTSTVTFAPTYGQAYTGSLTVTGGNSAIQTVSLSGDGRVSAVPNGVFYAPSNVLFSPDKTYWLAMQSDCNLVEYHNGAGIWNTNTSNGATNCSFAIQGDGNLVVYKGTIVSTNAVWDSNTAGHGSIPIFIQLGNDGIIHEYEGTVSSPGIQLWQN
jgi:hypothetical protein